MKEVIKVITVKKVLFVTIVFLIKGLDLTMLSLTISDIAIITVKGVDYCCIIHDLSKSGANNLLKSLCLIIVDVYKICFKEIKIKNLVYSYFFDNLIKAKNIENKNI